jgi:hypothetical protein
MMAELDGQGADAAYHFYRAIQGSRDSVELVGRMFETTWLCIMVCTFRFRKHLFGVMTNVTFHLSNITLPARLVTTYSINFQQQLAG